MTLDESWGWKSWVESANEPGCGFPLQNLPFCLFEVEDHTRIGVGVGDSILDLGAAAKSGLFAYEPLPPELKTACCAPNLNALMACGLELNRVLRRALMLKLRDDRNDAAFAGLFIRPMEGAVFRVPADVGDYADFYASLHHATNVGKLFRPDAPLLPNYMWVPIGYHGRASSLVVSGTEVRRPWGQAKAGDDPAPSFGPSKQLDYELEVAAYIGKGNALGEPIGIGDAERHLFGISLLNDWSARDIQAWEYQPLGPFLGKSFASSVSPWVVTMEALEPFRVHNAQHQPEDLEYLRSNSADGIDLKLEVHLSTSAMRLAGIGPVRVSQGNFREMYWSFRQMVAHHASNGCNLRPGDLLGSGTVSGLEHGAQGCLLEMARRGASPVTLPNGEDRSFLEDGDEVILSGYCEREGLPRISLGGCRGVILPALAKG